MSGTVDHFNYQSCDEKFQYYKPHLNKILD
jgi:hypothetical protein